MLQSSEHQPLILLKLKQNGSLKSVLNLLSSLSEMFMLPKPHAFDQTQGIQYYDEKLINANEKATYDILHDVDVVMESYRREIIFKLFKIFNIIFDIKNKEEPQQRARDMFPFISEIRSDYPSEECREFTKTLQKVIIKWTNFDDEFEVSSEIFDLLGEFDEKTQSLAQ